MPRHTKKRRTTLSGAFSKYTPEKGSHGFAKQKMKQKKISGTEKFNAYYSGIYGERWEGLKTALLKEKDTVSLSDLLSEPYYMDKASIFAAAVLPLERYSCGSSASPKKSESADPANIKDNPNSFDPAKDIAAGVSNASCETQESASSQSVKILDMCAAPGGKSASRRGHIFP